MGRGRSTFMQRHRDKRDWREGEGRSWTERKGRLDLPFSYLRQVNSKTQRHNVGWSDKESIGVQGGLPTK